MVIRRPDELEAAATVAPRGGPAPHVAPGRLRVLHVINEMGVGGAETLVVTLAAHAGDWRWQTWLASSGGALETEARNGGAVTRRIPVVRRSRAGVIRSTVQLRAIIAEATPEVVLAHNVAVSVVAALATRAWRPVTGRPPVVTVFHGVAEPDLPQAASLLRRTSRSVIAVSNAAADQLAGAGYPRERLTVISNAVTRTRPPGPTPPGLRTRLGLPHEDVIALCLARMVEQKRHDVLLQAWARTTSGLLLLSGDGPLREGIERQCEELGLSQRVRFLGVRDDVEDLLDACDFTVLASDWEGLPMAALESLSAGRPVVATAVGGLGEVVDGRCGTLVPRRDPDALAAAAQRLIDDPALRAEMGEHALAAASGFSAASMMSSYDRVLRTGSLAPASATEGPAHS